MVSQANRQSSFHARASARSGMISARVSANAGGQFASGGFQRGMSWASSLGALAQCLVLLIVACVGCASLADGVPAGGAAVYRSQSPGAVPGSLLGSRSDHELLSPLGSDEPLLPGQEEPRGLVLGVTVTGNKNVKKSEILRHIKTRKDRTYDPQLVQEDLRRLFATRKFHNVGVRKKS